MKLGIMQPYFLPYLGYYSIIKQVDRYIFFDTPQYIYHGWVNRNRILKQGGTEWQYINVPVQKHAREYAIKDVKIDNSQNWQGKLMGQLSHYKKRAPYYTSVTSMLLENLTDTYVTIGDLDISLDMAICKYLGINTHMERFSEMGLSICDVNSPDEWALRICEALGNVDEYWNAPGGAEFFDRNKYERAGIQLRFEKMRLHPYPQLGGSFVPGLSVLDAMMFNAPEKIRSMLDDYEFI